MNLATMLDPRFHSRYMDQEKSQIIKDRAVSEMELFLLEIEEAETPPQVSGSAENTIG